MRPTRKHRRIRKVELRLKKIVAVDYYKLPNADKAFIKKLFVKMIKKRLRRTRMTRVALIA